MSAWVWIGGFLLAAHGLRSAAGLVWLRRHSTEDCGDRSILPSGLALRVSPLLDTPLLAGFFRPGIYLPVDSTAWPEGKRRCVLLHEMAHHSARDAWWQLAGVCAACVWWWYPLAWLALARLKAEAEEAADDTVVLREGAPQLYAGLLVEMASLSSGEAHAGIAICGRSSLEKRIRSILAANPRRNTFGGWGAGLLGSLSAAILICTGIGVVLGEADLTNADGEIRHYQANPADNRLAQGNFPGDQWEARWLDGNTGGGDLTGARHHSDQGRLGPGRHRVQAGHAAHMEVAYRYGQISSGAQYDVGFRAGCCGGLHF